MVAARHKAGVWLVLSLAWAGFGWGAAAPNRTSATGNHYRITTWTTAQGLPQNTVNCLLQTRDGYLWCGTRCGLARFDGLRFTIFAEAFGQESTEVLDVQDLAEDAQGRIWLRLPTGLVSFEHGAFTKMNLEVDLTPAAQKLCGSRSGGLWVSLRDGAAYLDQGKITRVFHFTNRELDLAEQVDLLQEDSQGRLWLRIHRQPNAWWWTRYDPATGKVETLAQVAGCTADDVSGLLEEEEDRRYWIVRPGTLICGTPGDMKQFSASNAWNGQPIKQMVMDQQRNLWVLSEGESQLHCFDAGECMKFGWGAGVPDPGDIRCLLPDREGNLWVGTIKSIKSENLLTAIQEAHRGSSPMSSRIARMLVQSFHRPGPRQPSSEALTSREEEVLSLIAKGCRTKEVAGQLGISPLTVETHIRNIYEKFHVRSRAGAVAQFLKGRG